MCENIFLSLLLVLTKQSWPNTALVFKKTKKSFIRIEYGNIENGNIEFNIVFLGTHFWELIFSLLVPYDSVSQPRGRVPVPGLGDYFTGT